MDKIEQFNQYCEKSGCPNCVQTFSLWNALNVAQEKLKELEEKISLSSQVTNS